MVVAGVVTGRRLQASLRVRTTGIVVPVNDSRPWPILKDGVDGPPAIGAGAGFEHEEQDSVARNHR